jgi:hypothetical protein
MSNNLEFITFLEAEFMKDVKKTVLKIPAAHQKLVQGYKFKAEVGNTLSGDPGNVGEIDEKKKRIKIAAPWNYSREFTVLHEVGHAVWKYIVTDQKKKEWTQLLKKTKSHSKENKQYLNQNDEEIFCMLYAQHYCKNGMVKFEHPELETFIAKLPS